MEHMRRNNWQLTLDAWVHQADAHPGESKLSGHWAHRWRNTNSMVCGGRCHQPRARSSGVHMCHPALSHSWLPPKGDTQPFCPPAFSQHVSYPTEVSLGTGTAGGLHVLLLGLWGVQLGRYSWESQRKPGGEPQSSTDYAPQHSTAWARGAHSSLSSNINLFPPKQAKVDVRGADYRTRGQGGQWNQQQRAPAQVENPPQAKELQSRRRPQRIPSAFFLSPSPLASEKLTGHQALAIN